MKTAQERRALAEIVVKMTPLIDFSGSDQDEMAQGMVQALNDVANENRYVDIFEMEKTAAWSPIYAKAYIAGRTIANTIMAQFAITKGFPGDKGFNAVSNYGRSH